MLGSDKGDYYKAVARLFYNGLKFRYLRRIGVPLKPIVVSLALTNRCNSHCIMCNIWKKAKEPDIKGLEMSQDKIIELFGGPLFSELVELDLTGGEPHLRDDLADIILGISEMKRSFLPKLRSIVVASNGLLPQQIITNHQKILGGLKDRSIDIVSVSSIDGVGQTHDLVRGTKGAFELVIQTINGLSELRQEYPNFLMGIKTTILPHNVNQLSNILDFARQRNLFHIISWAYFTDTRYRNMDKKAELMLGPEERKEVLEVYGRDELKPNYFYATARDYLIRGRRHWVCAALHGYVFIDFDGKVYPCEIISIPVSDVKDQKLEDVWNNSSAHWWRRRIGKMECCATCNEPGAIRYSAYAEGFGYLRFLVKLGRYKFSQSFYQEGFSKYFGK